MIMSNPAMRYFASKFNYLSIRIPIDKVIKVPKMGDSISEGTVQSFVKSKYRLNIHLKKSLQRHSTFLVVDLNTVCV